MHTQHTEITHAHNINLKLAFHKVVFFHQHYLTYSLQTYHHPGTKQINLTLNPHKTTCTLFTPDHAEYKSNLDLKINSTSLPMATNVLGLTLDPKLDTAHIHNISVQPHKPLQMMKTLTATGWGKQKEILMATYNAVMRLSLEYASTIWSPLAYLTSIYKLQVMQNAACRTATGCTNIQHLQGTY